MSCSRKDYCFVLVMHCYFFDLVEISIVFRLSYVFFGSKHIIEFSGKCTDKDSKEFIDI